MQKRTQVLQNFESYTNELFPAHTADVEFLTRKNLIQQTMSVTTHKIVIVFCQKIYLIPLDI